MRICNVPTNAVWHVEQIMLMCFFACRWFHFRLTGVQNTALVVKLVNAGKSSFPEAWPGYKACASYDLKEWFRIQTTWDDKAGVITMEHTSNHVSI